MTNKQYVQNTPLRASISAHAIGVGTVSDNKELLRELEGFVIPFDSAHLEALLNKTASTRSCQQYLSFSSNSIYGADGWSDIPELPDTHKELYTPLVEIANSVIHHFCLDKTSRQVFDTHDKNWYADPIEEGLKARPDIIFTGSGQHFTGELSQYDHWYQCLSTISVKKELFGKHSLREETENEEEQGPQEQLEKKGLVQLAYYARQIFSSQPTRLFVYNILITERRVRLYRFDRVGVQYSNWIDYHDEPTKLVQLIHLVASPSSTEVGLDEAVTFKDDRVQFTFQKNGQPFIVTANQTPRFAYPGLRGRATVCWSVRDKVGNPYLLKQQFVSTCRELEHKFMEIVEQTNADLSAVGTCFLAQEFSKVSESRGMSVPVPKEFQDLRLYRLLLTEHGDTIDNLTDKSSLDVLVAIRDAILGHKALWDAGIIHRDISTNNILYRKRDGAESTLRGVLIDFDLAVEFQREGSHATIDFRIGTRAFQSIGVLQSYQDTDDAGVEDKRAVVLHEHLDDLESFFWVLFWTTRGQVGPGSDAKPVEKLKVRHKMESSVENSRAFKMTVLMDYYKLALQPGWGLHTRTLVQNLAKFFNGRNHKKFRAVWDTKVAMDVQQLVEIAPRDYETVLGFFDVAIAAIKEDLPSTLSDPLDDSKQLEGRCDRVNPLPNPSALLPDLNIGLSIRASLKRPPEADDPQIPQPPPGKRVRTEPALQATPRITRAVSLKMRQDAKQATAEEIIVQDVNSDGQSANKGFRTTRPRSSASQFKDKASTSRAGRQTRSMRSTLHSRGKKA